MKRTIDVTDTLGERIEILKNRFAVMEKRMAKIIKMGKKIDRLFRRKKRRGSSSSPSDLCSESKEISEETEFDEGCFQIVKEFKSWGEEMSGGEKSQEVRDDREKNQEARSDSEKKQEELQKTLEDFTSQKNWDQFFTIRRSDDSFEWYAEWPQPKSLFTTQPSFQSKEQLDSTEPPRATEVSILVPGYGNSKLSEHLYDDVGFKNITNIDFSKVVELRTLHKGEEELYFYDVFAYPWEKNKHYKMVYQLEKKYFSDQCYDKAFLESGKSNSKQKKELGGKSVETKGDEDKGLVFFYESEKEVKVEENVTEKKVEDFFKCLMKFPNEKGADIAVAVSFLSTRSIGLPPKWDGPKGTVVLVNKPKGWTSLTVCGKLRRRVNVKNIGHAGTLDPMATGLLIVCVGKATKVADKYQGMIKGYSGVLCVGEATSTWDALMDKMNSNSALLSAASSHSGFVDDEQQIMRHVAAITSSAMKAIGAVEAICEENFELAMSMDAMRFHSTLDDQFFVFDRGKSYFRHLVCNWVTWENLRELRDRFRFCP